jgi:hypothetical protein
MKHDTIRPNMKREQDNGVNAGCTQEIESLAENAQKSLKELAEKVKGEKIDKNKLPRVRAYETLEFASTLTDIPSINDYLTRRGRKDPEDLSRDITLIMGCVEGLTYSYDRPVVVILPKKLIHYFGEEFKMGTSKNEFVSNTLNEDWDFGKVGKKAVDMLAKLSKADVIKKFQEQVKA